MLTAGLAAPWAVASVTADVSSWVTRLSKEVADVVLSARNLKGLLDKAGKLLDDVGAAFGRITSNIGEAAAKAGDDVAGAARQVGDFLSSLRPQQALAGAPGMTMAQAHQVGKANPTVYRPKSPKTAKPSRPNPNEGRWGVNLNETSTGAKGADDAADAAAASTGGKPDTKLVDEYADRGDGRDVKGRYANGNGGAHMYDQSEALGLERYTSDLNREGVTSQRGYRGQASCRHRRSATGTLLRPDHSTRGRHLGRSGGQERRLPISRHPTSR